MRSVFLAVLGLVTVSLALAPLGASIRHDSGCRPAGFGGTDAPDSWMLADALGGLNCVGEMHPTAGGPFPDDQDWYYVNVPAGSNARLTVTICPTGVFVAGWNPNLQLSFLPAAGAAPATPAQLGQGAHYLQPALSKVPALLPLGASANGSGCDSVVTAAPPVAPGGGRYYINVQRGAGGGIYSMVTSLA